MPSSSLAKGRERLWPPQALSPVNLLDRSLRLSSHEQRKGCSVSSSVQSTATLTPRDRVVPCSELTVMYDRGRDVLHEVMPMHRTPLEMPL